MNERERAQHFYEMLTGVFNDEQSKIIRYVCFAVLFAGMMWAGFNYFRASILADTDKPLDPDMFQDAVQIPRNDAALQRIADLAQTVDAMRNVGSSLAGAMDRLHHMPFNLDPESNPLDVVGDSVPGAVNVPSAPETPRQIPVKVKMIMTADNGDRIAVVDAGGVKSLVLRRGDEIPGGGFVRSIRPDGITVIIDKQEVKYDVPEIPMYNSFGVPRGKTAQTQGN